MKKKAAFNKSQIFVCPRFFAEARLVNSRIRQITDAAVPEADKIYSGMGGIEPVPKSAFGLNCQVFFQSSGYPYGASNIDQAYTHLKESVDEIRLTGQYGFRQNIDRFTGYRSKHIRQLTIKKRGKPKKKGVEKNGDS